MDDAQILARLAEIEGWKLFHNRLFGDKYYDESDMHRYPAGYKSPLGTDMESKAQAMELAEKYGLSSGLDHDAGGWRVWAPLCGSVVDASLQRAICLAIIEASERR